MMDKIHDEPQNHIANAVAEVVASTHKKDAKRKRCTTIGFRATEQLKAQFIEACNGEEYSHVMEKLVVKYIESITTHQAIERAASNYPPQPK